MATNSHQGFTPAELTPLSSITNGNFKKELEHIEREERDKVYNYVRNYIIQKQNEEFENVKRKSDQLGSNNQNITNPKLKTHDSIIKQNEDLRRIQVIDTTIQKLKSHLETSQPNEKQEAIEKMLQNTYDQLD